MHRYGTLDIAARAAGAPALKSLKGEPWTLKGVRTLDFRMEVEAGPADALIPPSLRPAIPSYGSIAVSHAADSPVGPFALAELRMGVRVGAIAGFFVVGAVCDSDAAAKALAEGWGYPVRRGDVALTELYHQVSAEVTVDGSVALQMRLTDRRVLPGTRLNLSSIINLARVGGAPLLVHVPVQASWAQADGGRQRLDSFDPQAFGAGEAFRPAFPMSAAFGTAEIVLGAPDYTIDPTVPAEESLTPVAA